jgi:uncharacterized protein (DUF302 family)
MVTMEFPRIIYRTAKPVAEVRTRIEEAAKSKGFGVLAVHDLGAILQSKGMPLSYPAVVVEVCSPRHAKTVLESHPPISNALPCRIAIYGRDGETTIETLPPTMLLAGFGKTGLEPVAQEVETLLKEIIEAAV